MNPKQMVFVRSCGAGRCRESRKSLILQTSKPEYSRQERRNASEFGNGACCFQFLLQHQEQSEKTRIDGANIRKIKRDPLPGCGRLAKRGDGLVHMLSIGGAGETHSDGI